MTEFISRFQPNSWSGSLATILEKRIPLLRSLNPENIEELRPFLKEAEKRLQHTMDIHRERELERESGRNASFE